MSTRRLRVVQWGTGNIGRRLDEDARQRVTTACAAGRSSISSTGSSPGFVTDALPFALLSLQRRVDLIEIDEFADLSQRDCPHLLFEQMGFGRPLASADPGRAAYLLEEFRPSLRVLAEAAGHPVDEWRSAGELAVARQTTKIRAGEVRAGTVGAQRTVLTGARAGVDVVEFRASWYCTTDVQPTWDLRRTGWRMRVHGDAPLDVEVGFPVSVGELADVTPAYTANRPVNAIAAVCAAPPGILSTADLPAITPGPSGARAR